MKGAYNTIKVYAIFNNQNLIKQLMAGQQKDSKQ